MSDVITFPPVITQHQCAHLPKARGLSLFLQRIRFRRMLARDLLHAPDSVLKDAGFTRSDVLREIAKPVWRR